MANPFRVKRGTKSQLNTAAGSSGLAAGEPYLITDEGGRLAVGTAGNAFVMAQIRGVAGFCGGKPANAEVVLAAVAPYPFTITQANCSAKAQTAATASTVFQLKKNGTNVCTLTFAASGTVATIGTVSSGAVVTGDVLTIHAPATADATCADIAFLIRE